MGDRWIQVGLGGMIVTAICCFTPILVFALTTLGTASLVVYLDAVLFPLLFGFTTLLVFGLIRRHHLRKRENQAG